MNRPALLGFQEVNLGRAAYHMWYSQGTLSQYDDTLDDLAGLGGTPWEEHAWEEGVEAPPRPRWRSPSSEWQVEPAPLPSPELMEAWSISEAEMLSEADRALEELRRREITRAAEEVAAERRRFARAKARATKLRRDRELAAARVQRAARREIARAEEIATERLRSALPPPAKKRRQRFVSMEQLAAFLGED